MLSYFLLIWYENKWLIYWMIHWNMMKYWYMKYILNYVCSMQSIVVYNHTIMFFQRNGEKGAHIHSLSMFTCTPVYTFPHMLLCCLLWSYGIYLFMICLSHSWHFFSVFDVTGSIYNNFNIQRFICISWMNIHANIAGLISKRRKKTIIVTRPIPRHYWICPS